MRVFAITLCFNRQDILKASLDQYAATRNKELPYIHVLVDQKYPLPAHRPAWTLPVDSIPTTVLVVCPGRNLGLAKGFNLALSEIEKTYGAFREEDYIIGYDGDSYPISPGWDMALITALSADPRVVWASLMHKRAEIELAERGYTERMANQVRMWVAHRPCVNSVCAFKASWLKSIGGFIEPQEFYGGLECALWQKMNHKIHDWAYLPDYRECEPEAVPFEQDFLYKDWKWRYAHVGDIKTDFETWLRSTGKI